jgi:hypothetical protein
VARKCHHRPWGAKEARHGRYRGSKRIHKLALAALVTLSVAGGAAPALAATLSQERALERQASDNRWKEAGLAQDRAAGEPGSAEAIPEPPPTPQTQSAPAGDRRGNATVTAAALLLALVARPIRRWPPAPGPSAQLDPGGRHGR